MLNLLLLIDIHLALVLILPINAEEPLHLLLVHALHKCFEGFSDISVLDPELLCFLSLRILLNKSGHLRQLSVLDEPLQVG